MIKKLNMVTGSIKGINTYSKRLFTIAMLIFNVLVIAGGTVMLFPRLIESDILRSVLCDCLLSTALKTVAIGSMMALLLDFWVKKEQQ